VKIRKGSPEVRRALGEIEAMFQLVASGCSEEVARSFSCPKCEDKMELIFDRGGRLLLITCAAKSCPMGLDRWLPSPPKWWRSFRVEDLKNKKLT